MQAISGNSSYTLLLLEKKLPSHFLSPFFSKSMMLWFSVITRCLFNTTQQQDLGEMGMRKDWICILHTSSHVNLTLACVLFACFLHLQPPSSSSSFSQHSVDNFPSWLPSDFMSDEASRANFFLRRHSHVSLSTSFLYNRHWQSKGKEWRARFKYQIRRQQERDRQTVTYRSREWWVTRERNRIPNTRGCDINYNSYWLISRFNRISWEKLWRRETFLPASQS